MAVEKQGYSIPFGQGLDTKTDPFQVAAGKMLNLQNVIFSSSQLQKRNGFGALTKLPENTGSTTLTTLNNTLIATGSNLYAYSRETNQWLSRGTIQPVDLQVVPLVRNSASQTAADSAVSNAGLVCTVYKNAVGAYYQINDVDGQIMVAQTALPTTAAIPRVFVLRRHFVITFTATVAAAPHLQYITIPLNNPTMPSTAADVSSQISSLNAGYDGVVTNDTLYLAWDGNDMGGAIRMIFLTSSLVFSAEMAKPAYSSTLMSLCADISGSTPIIWVSFWETSANDGYSMAVNPNLDEILAPTQIIDDVDINEITSVATNGVVSIFYENDNEYSYASVRTDFISKLTVTTSGSVSATTVMLRGVGLASKAFYHETTPYMLLTYGGAFQPTYFLSDSSGNVVMKLAYSNGGGYQVNQILPSVYLVGSQHHCAYVFKDQLVSVSKATDAPSVGGIYSQTGVNLVKFEINQSGQLNSEIANCLQLTGGIMWQYDAVKPVEHGFHLWPEDIDVSTDTSGGNIEDGDYFYAFTYEWTDAQGSLHRSAPSIPFGISTTGGDTSTNTIDVPTLRITYKTTPNIVRIVGYRFSASQPVFYQFTSITSPELNNPAVDSIEIEDTAADATILGNTILYTTGGVLENIGAPANSGSTLFKNRQWIIDAEDRNLLWYSKQVLSGVPVEFSDLLTLYVSPTAITQGASTGPCTAISAMDDKLIIFKRKAIYYVTGSGPDNTGANNDLSEPTFITSAVGCVNSNSIVFMPEGIMFQASETNGIWMLKRNLETVYIGSPVQLFNNLQVVSALTNPSSTEVRFTLENGTVLMYDYFYDQWCQFTGIPAISSTVFDNLHTYLNVFGEIRQETPNRYLDGTNPVLIKLTTAWFKLTNIQGFQRAYFFYFLGVFKSPHKMNIDIAHDYDESIRQSVLITPINSVDRYGDDVLYGSGSPYGGGSSIEQWRVFLNRQKCQSMQLTISEIYDPSSGIEAGAGFTMSGLNLVFGAKASYPKLPSGQSAG